MKEIINTSFEASLRILCILFNNKKPLSQEKIIFLDFIYSYSKSFDCIEMNLHGENKYKFSEITARKKLIEEALKQLSFDKYVKPCFSKLGTQFLITEKGMSFINNMNDDYFHEYMKLISMNDSFLFLSENELREMFNEKSKGE